MDIKKEQQKQARYEGTCTRKAEAGGIKHQCQPGLYGETLSKKEKRKEYSKKIGGNYLAT